MLNLPNITVHAFDTLPSTQDFLLPIAREKPTQPVLCVTRAQTQGRGRGDKSWHAIPDATLCFSLCMRMKKPLHALEGVTLAWGVALVQVLEGLGAQGLRLKWPNDIYGGNGKLAGILTETYADSPETTYVVVGVGLNVDLPDNALPALTTPWTDVLRCMPPGALVPHDRLLERLVESLLQAAALYEQHGFAVFHALYDAHDMLKGQMILHQGREVTVLGVDSQGMLRVR